MQNLSTSTPSMSLSRDWVLALLQSALTSTDTQSHQKVYHSISDAEDFNSFYGYLVDISSDNLVGTALRQIALVTLKSALKRNQLAL